MTYNVSSRMLNPTTTILYLGSLLVGRVTRVGSGQENWTHVQLWFISLCSFCGECIAGQKERDTCARPYRWRCSLSSNGFVMAYVPDRASRMDVCDSR